MELFWDAKLDCNILKAGLRESDKEQKCKAINTICKHILDQLTAASTTELMTKPFLEFLERVSKNRYYPPQNYLFNFELSRLQFNSFGALKCQNSIKQLMIMAFFIFIRIVIHRLILRAHTYDSEIKKTELYVINSKIIGSLLYCIIMDFFTENVAIHFNN